MSPPEREPTVPNERDRDLAGRPRNNRPRDGLGRPLPRGSAGVPPQVEARQRTPAQTILEAQRLLDAGMPFHAHEVFEDAWRSAPAKDRELWRGLAQIAVGLTHAERDNPRGAGALLRRGADNLASSASTALQDVDVPRLVVWSYAAAEAVGTGGELPAMPRLSRTAPRG
jgi:uncharacterized protein